MELTTAQMFWAQVAVTAASAAYNISQANKAKKAAKAAAEARKGFEVPTEGSIRSAPIVYGRAKIGGTRVWHATANSYVHTTSNAQISFTAGPSNSASGSITSTVGQTINNFLFSQQIGHTLNASVSGSKNEFLFYHQALCAGEINKCIDVIINDSQYLNDPTFSPTQDFANSSQAGMRFDVHYAGNEYDAITAANFTDRRKALFPSVAYASCVFRLNRDDPQFNGIPDVQFLIEGKKVRSVAAGVLSGTRVYSNNPAWCLLDYLLDPLSGKGLSEASIDLASFEAAASVCGTIVQSDVIVGGKIWQNTTGTTNISTRDLPLYECNIILDPDKTVRDNIEAILATMGDARLVWSGGKYKLSVQYPATNAAVVTAATITDDDLVLGSEIKISWPGLDQKLNSCIVRYSNESENFKEDTVQWPPKTNTPYYKGVGGTKYLPINSYNGGNDDFKNFMNNYGVWDGTTALTTLSYKFMCESTGTYSLSYAGDDTITISISGTSVSNLVANYPSVITTPSVAMTAGVLYTITISGSNVAGGNLKGVAAKLEKSSEIWWTTRDTAFSDILTVTPSKVVHDAMLVEDNGILLENEVYGDGITDYYHALAKAEELVRTSRSAFAVEFKYIVRGNFLEPGDFIKLNTTTLGLGVSPENPLYLRINEVKINEEGTCDVSAVRFDYTQLAWNVKDDEYLKPQNIFETEIPAVTDLQYLPNSLNILNSSGKLTWVPPAYGNTQCYIVYYHVPGNNDNNNLPIFDEIGRAVEDSFILPGLKIDTAVFGVRLLSTSGRMSKMVTTGTTAVNLVHSWATDVEIEATALAFVKKADGTYNLDDITFTAVTTGFVLPTFEWFVKGVLQIGEVSDTFILPRFTDESIKSVKVVVTETGVDLYQTDEITVFYLEDGSSAYNIGLSNPNITLTCDSAGTPKAGQLPVAINIYMAKGAEILLPANLSYSITTPNNYCTANVNTTTGVLNLTGISNAYGSVIVTVTETATGVARSISLFVVKSLDGQAGVSRVNALTFDKGFFITEKNSTAHSPENIILTSQAVGFISPVYSWYVDGALQAGQTANTFTVPYFAPPTAKTIKSSVEELSDNTIVRSDTYTIPSIREGDDSYTINIENDNITFPASDTNTILNGYLPLNIPVRIYKGGTEVTTGNGFTYSVALSGCSATINSTTGVVNLTTVASLFAYITVTATSTEVTLNKIITLTLTPKGSTGSAGYSVDLTNEAHVVPANAAGVVSSYAGASGKMNLYSGPSLINSGVTYTYVTSSGFSTEPTASIDANGNYTITGVTTGGVLSNVIDVATVVYRAAYDGNTYDKVFTISKSKTGDSATAYEVEANVGSITKDSGGSPLPSSITWSAYKVTGVDSRVAATGMTFDVEYSVNGSTWNSITSVSNASTSGAINILSYSTAKYYRCVLKTNTAAVVDIETIAVISDGSPGSDGVAGINLFLTNDAHNLYANGDGSVSATELAAATTTARVFVGLVEDTSNWTFTHTSSAGVTASKSVNVFTLTDMTADSGYVDITATKAGQPTLVKRFSVSKTKNAPTVALSNGFNVVKYDATGLLDQRVMLYASAMNVTGTVYYEFVVNSVSVQNTTTRSYEWTPPGSYSATLATVTVNIRLGSAGAGVSASETFTVYGLNTSATARGFLTTESRRIQTDGGGTVSDISDATVSMVIAKSGAEDTVNWSFTKSESGCTATINGNCVTLTSMTSSPASVTITASKSGETNISKTAYFYKTYGGAAAYIESNSPLVGYLSGWTNPIPISIITATARGTATASLYFEFLRNRVPFQNTLLNTFVYIPPENFASLPETVSVKLRSGSTTSITLASDTAVIGGVKTGADGPAGQAGIVAILSNESHTLASDAAGVVSSYTGATSTLQIFEGDTDVTNLYTITRANGGNVTTSTLSGATVTVTAVSSTVDLGYVDFTATRSGYATIVKRFSISKSKGAPTISISSDYTAFSYNSSGTTPSPASVTVSTTVSGISGTLYYEFLKDGTSVQASSTTSTYTYTPQANYTNMPDSIMVRLRLSVSGTVIAVDTLNMVGIKPGVDGLNGTRGSRSLSTTNASVQKYPGRTTGWAKWSIGANNSTNATAADLVATTAICNAVSAPSISTVYLLIGDSVTITNGSSVAVTGAWDGSKWSDPGQVIDGNLLVTGSVTASAINANTLTVDKLSGSPATTATNGGSFNFGQGATFKTVDAAVVITQATNTKLALIAVNTATSGTERYAVGFGNVGTASLPGAGGSYTYAGVSYCFDPASDYKIALTTHTIAGRDFGSYSETSTVAGIAPNQTQRPSYQFWAGYALAGAISRRVHPTHATLTNYMHEAQLATTNYAGEFRWYSSDGSVAPSAYRFQALIGSSTYAGRFEYWASGTTLTNWAEIASTTHAVKYTGTVGSFTGAHDALIENGETMPVPGDIVIETGVAVYKAIADTLTKIKLSPSANHKAVLGVFYKQAETDDYPVVFTDFEEEDRLLPSTVEGRVIQKSKKTKASAAFTALAASNKYVLINSLGEGLINVCGEAGDIEAGDLIVSSSIPGKGMKQSDDIVRNKTVAKAREPVTFSSPTEVKQIACIYLCG